MLIRAIDLETTGVPTEQDRHAICEVGWCDVTMLGGGDIFVGETFGMITDPGRPMPPEARAVHHISDTAILERGVPIHDALAALMSGPPDIFCAHNGDFERSFFGGGEVSWLCS